MFKYLLGYSPVHNVNERDYPAVLVTTGDHDDRVVPAHSYKFAAHLQASNTGINPTLIRIERSAGHGAGNRAELHRSPCDRVGFVQEGRLRSCALRTRRC